MFDYLHILLAFLNISVFSCLIILIAKSRFKEDNYNQRIEKYKQEEEIRQKDLEISNSKISELEKNNIKLETDFNNIKEQTALKDNELHFLKNKVAEYTEKLHESDKSENILKQKLIDKEEQINDWYKDKEKHMEVLKASMLKAGHELSNKLLEDHKRENKESKESNEKIIKETTKDLENNFQNIANKVSSLNDDVKKQTKTVDLINNALINPQSSGSLSEITLENFLNNSGLKKDIDYKIQFGFKDTSGNSLRPDAIVFLPDNDIIVIDSKSSVHFLEEDKERHDKMLKESMNKHLESLVKKDYIESVKSDLKSKGREVNNITMVMFVPSDQILFKICNIDKDFHEKCKRKNIIVSGPAILHYILSLSIRTISCSKQNKNTLLITEEVKKLLLSISRLYNLSEKMGKSIKTSLKNYDEFAASFNGNFVPKTQKIMSLGIDIPKNKEIYRLPKYAIIENNGIIENEIIIENEMTVENEMAIESDRTIDISKKIDFNKEETDDII